MIGDRKEIARMQSDFYRDLYRKMLRWIILCLFICMILIGSIIYKIFFQPVQTYYGNTTEGKILAMPPAVIRQTS